MKRKQFTEAQIAFALRQAESGTPVAEIIRKMGASSSSHKTRIISEPVFRGQTRMLREKTIRKWRESQTGGLVKMGILHNVM